MTLSFFAAQGGEVPVILCQPADKPAERGEILREQLAERGIDLPAYGEIRGTLVLLHGRKGRKEDLLPVAERFVAVGYRCLLPDLPAHGESPLRRVRFGADPQEAALPMAVLQEAQERFHWEFGPKGLWGMSMGGAFAIHAMGQWEARIVVASFADLEEVAEEFCRKWAGPAGPLASHLALSLASMRGDFDYRSVKPRESARRIKSPTLVAHGTEDELLSLAEGMRLYRAVGAPQKRWLAVPDGGHDDVLITPMELYAEMAMWYATHL
ncbi:MAG: alpha/beta fold hydrolase [Verrucomicrobiota bacterium]